MLSLEEFYSYCDSDSTNSRINPLTLSGEIRYQRALVINPQLLKSIILDTTRDRSESFILSHNNAKRLLYRFTPMAINPNVRLQLISYYLMYGYAYVNPILEHRVKSNSKLEMLEIVHLGLVGYFTGFFTNKIFSLLHISPTADTDNIDVKAKIHTIVENSIVPDVPIPNNVQSQHSLIVSSIRHFLLFYAGARTRFRHSTNGAMRELPEIFVKNDTTYDILNNLTSFGTFRSPPIFTGEISIVPPSEPMDINPQPIIEEQQCCKIGLEIEFWAENLPSEFKNKHKIITEYYSNQYELNDFISEFKTKKDIKKFFRVVKKRVKDITSSSPSSLCFKTAGRQVDDYSIVFNGCHLHISLETVEATKKFYRFLTSKNIIEKFKFENFPSVRSVMSHHIWGKYRSSQYNYKRKSRFAPIVFTAFNTIELRLWDNEDILTLKRADKIASLIIDSLNAFRNNKTDIESWSSELYDIQSTEDVTKMFNILKSKLSANSNNHKLAGDYIMLPSKQILKFKENQSEGYTTIHLQGSF